MTIKALQRKINVPWTRISIRAEMNARSDHDDPEYVATLAKSIQDSGLDHDVTVILDPTKPAPESDYAEGSFLVIAGFTRWGAISYLAAEQGWPDDHLVTVTLVTYTEPGDIYDRNLVENVVRRDLRTGDLARRLYERVEGLCADPAGGFVKKTTPQHLAETLGKSPSFVRELVRAWRGACPELREAWIKDVVAGDQVRAWCAKSPEKQKELLAAFVAGGGKVSNGAHASSDDGEDDGEDEGGAEGRAKKKAKKDDDERKAPTRTEILEKVEKLSAKLDGGELSKAEQVIIRARWEALRWAAGEIRRLG